MQKRHLDIENPLFDMQKRHLDIEKPFFDMQKRHLDIENPFFDMQKRHLDIEKSLPDMQRPDGAGLLERNESTMTSLKRRTHRFALRHTISVGQAQGDSSS
jgi:hypothetical protein